MVHMCTTGYPKKIVCVSFQGRCLLFEVRLFQHGVLFSFGGWLVVKEIGVRGWWTWAEVISQLRLIGPGCWLGAKHGGNRRFSFLSCRESRYSCACAGISISIFYQIGVGKNSYLQFSPIHYQ